MTENKLMTVNVRDVVLFKKPSKESVEKYSQKEKVLVRVWFFVSETILE